MVITWNGAKISSSTGRKARRVRRCRVDLLPLSSVMHRTPVPPSRLAKGSSAFFELTATDGNRSRFLQVKGAPMTSVENGAVEDEVTSFRVGFERSRATLSPAYRGTSPIREFHPTYHRTGRPDSRVPGGRLMSLELSNQTAVSYPWQVGNRRPGAWTGTHLPNNQPFFPCIL